MIPAIHRRGPCAFTARSLSGLGCGSRRRGRGMIGVDLFSGAGGLSLGAAQAGIDVRLAVESDPHAVMTYRCNHPRTRVLADDVRKLQVRDLPTDGTGKVLFGGPPCQGFSTSNQRTRKADNPNNWLFREFMRVAKLWQPDWVVLENVKGLVETAEGIFLEHIIDHMQRLGYTTTWWGPQCRRLRSTARAIPPLCRWFTRQRGARQTACEAEPFPIRHYR